MSSPFQQAADLMTTVAAQAGLLTTTRVHPGEGDTAERADDLASNTAQTAIQIEDWLTDTAALAETQATADAGLMAAPKPADLSAWHHRINAGGMDAATKQAEIHLFLQAAKQRREALDAHTAATITEVPELPASVCTVPVDGGAEGSGKTQQGADGAATPEDEAPEAPSTAPESGTDEAPVSMSDAGTPETPTFMSTGTTGREPTPLSDTSAGTELSSSAMTADPSAARGALGQPMGTAQGQGTQVSFAQQPPAAQTGIPASQQLSQPTAGQRGGTGTPRTGSRNPESRRDDQDPAAQAVSGVGLAGATGTMAAMASAPSSSSPGTATSGAPVAPAAPATPNAAPNAAPGGAAPVGGTGMGGGLGRGGTLGSGSNVKPIISTEQPPTPQLTPEEQKLLDEYDKKDGTK